ncbi:zinc finger protein 395 [Spodoptera frugiperda]|uniref:Zinc finger protein 395 n=1 Tax=Spodoptera frugiperda TaxID=7108 RepID=A0A9R0CVR5_SPOFR|nr:zinc finger protein 395 [Spodoptera frugiperda]
MSTGKRLAKRSIIGTRVAALGDDGLYYSGMIHAVKTPAPFPENNNCINLTPNTRYTVRFDSVMMKNREYRDAELIGPGFRGMTGVRLKEGQRVFLTYNGREVHADVKHHDYNTDELLVQIYSPTSEVRIELKKKLDDVRLLESRKSARLADVDTDFARLADMAGDRRRSSATIEVPPSPVQSSRKRGPSSSCDQGYGERDEQMNECNAALVLMSLSCSPNSPRPSGWGDRSSVSPGASSSSDSSWRSGTPSPPPASSSFSDEGIAMDYEEIHPRKKRINSVVFVCTWRGCTYSTDTCTAIEAHIRNTHLGPKKEGDSDHEEEFYYTEREVAAPAPPPTLSHRDMCRPPHEDPEYQRQLVGSFRQGLLSTLQQGTGRSVNIPVTHHWVNTHSPKHMRLSAANGSPSSPGRRPRSDNKKCRKVYGMDQRDLWCTQCKWKKACTRFGD